MKFFKQLDVKKLLLMQFPICVLYTLYSYFFLHVDFSDLAAPFATSYLISTVIISIYLLYSQRDLLKKYLGIIWLLLGPISLYYLIVTAWHEMEKKPVIDTKIQWGVFIAIFIPIAIGLVIFGWYALQGEYEKIEE